MSTTHLGIVWNPSKTSQEQLEAGLTKALASSGVSPTVEWFETTVEDPGQDAAARAVASGADLVLAAGGDGTVRAVAERLAETEATAHLGIIPLGTGNLLARNLGVPLGNIAAAFERALTADPQPLDIAWVDLEIDGKPQRHAFAVIAGFGIDAHMITETDDDLKSKAGWLAYVESLGRALSASELLDIRVTVDNELPREESAHTFLIGNCGTLQGGITLLPDANPSDGELDLLALSADGFIGWADTLRNGIWDNGIKRVFTGEETAASSASATHGRATSVVLELSEPRVFEIDGEDLGETSRVEVNVSPGAVRIR